LKNSVNIFQKFSIYFFFEILNKVLPFAVLPIVASNVSVSEFGELGVFNALAYFFIVLISLNHYTFLSKEYYNPHLNGDYLFYNLLIRNTATGIFIFLFSLIINYILGNIYSFEIVIYAVLAAFFSSLNSLVLTFFITKIKPLTYGFLSFFQNLVLIACVYIFIEIISLGYTGRIYAQILSGIFAFLLSIPFFYSSISSNLKKIDFVLIKRSFIWTLPLLPHTLSFWAKSGLDTLIFDKYKGNELTGIYSILLMYSSLWMVFINSLFNVITPEYNSIMSRKPISLSEYLRWGILFSIGTLIILIAFYLCAMYFTKLFLPDNYSISLNFLKFLLPSLFFNSIYAYLSLNYFFNDRTKFLAKVSVFSAVLHLFLVLIVVQYLSFSMIILIQSVSSLIMVLILLFNLNLKECQVNQLN
jgi:O-antigen/teichoic acid export membrane protein